MKKVLVYILFVTASIGVVLVFVTSTSYTQLAIGSLLYPPLAYCAFVLLPRKNRKIVDTTQQSIPSLQVVAQTHEDDVDIDRRAFLKLIGAAGLSFFVFSIFTRKAEGVLFGKALQSGPTTLSDPDGKAIHPAEKSPTDGYQISEIDDNFISFYGFTNKEGKWYIMKEDTESGSFRYTKGETDFSDNWKKRQELVYDYYHHIFS